MSQPSVRENTTPTIVTRVTNCLGPVTPCCSNKFGEVAKAVN